MQLNNVLITLAMLCWTTSEIHGQFKKRPTPEQLKQEMASLKTTLDQQRETGTYKGPQGPDETRKDLSQPTRSLSKSEERLETELGELKKTTQYATKKEQLRNEMEELSLSLGFEPKATPEPQPKDLTPQTWVTKILLPGIAGFDDKKVPLFISRDNLEKREIFTLKNGKPTIVIKDDLDYGLIEQLRAIIDERFLPSIAYLINNASRDQKRYLRDPEHRNDKEVQNVVTHIKGAHNFLQKHINAIAQASKSPQKEHEKKRSADQLLPKLRETEKKLVKFVQDNFKFKVKTTNPEYRK